MPKVLTHPPPQQGPTLIRPQLESLMSRCAATLSTTNWQLYSYPGKVPLLSVPMIDSHSTFNKHFLNILYASMNSKNSHSREGDTAICNLILCRNTKEEAASPRKSFQEKVLPDMNFQDGRKNIPAKKQRYRDKQHHAVLLLWCIF